MGGSLFQWELKYGWQGTITAKKQALSQREFVSEALKGAHWMGVASECQLDGRGTQMCTFVQEY